MTRGKEQVVLHMSDDFKEMLGAYATENNLSMSEVIRRAVAIEIGYDLENEPARQRTPKYATPEEAKRAAFNRAALLRWGDKSSRRLLATGEIEAATLIARAVNNHDYETLEALRATSEAGSDE